jgi:ELWxxDGT repeat protein
MSSTYNPNGKRRRLQARHIAEILEPRRLLSRPPELVGEIAVGPASASPAHLADVNGTLFFAATSAATGTELYKSDGATVTLVKDINPGAASSSPSFLINVSGTAFFIANDGTTGFELWKSDGTTAGTVQVKDIRPGGSGAFQTDPVDAPFFANANGNLFFNAEDGVNGSELWKSDGTMAGTVLVKVTDFRGPGTATDGARNIAYANGILYFTTRDDVASVRTLWKSDGTAVGTVEVAELSSPAFITAFGGSTYFTDAAGGRDLYKTDGTTLGTVLVKDMPGAEIPQNFTVAGGMLFFAADDTSGWELWKTDGTDPGTSMVKDINPGFADSFPVYSQEFSGQLYFSAFDSANGRELWKSDGTAAGTVLVADTHPGAPGSVEQVTVIASTLYFVADGGSGPELWGSDGTGVGTAQVADINPGAAGSSPTNLTNVRDTAFFTADNGTGGIELWAVRPDAALVKDLRPGSGGSGPQLPGVLNGAMLFSATDANLGTELWRSDGTAAGTALLKDIRAGSSSSNPVPFGVVNGVMLLAANDGVSGLELWKSDGTTGGTVLVKDIRPGAANSLTASRALFNGYMYFAADDGVSGTELWRSDGTTAGTVLVKDINPGALGSLTSALTVVNGTLFFTADDGTSGFELWKTDGTTAGTVLVRDIVPGSGASVAQSLMDVNGTLFFRANDGTHGFELWKSDGTEAGTSLVKDIRAGSTNTTLGNFVPHNGRLLFSADDGVTGSELWSSDGTAAGTTLLKDIQSGTGSSTPQPLAFLGNDLLWSADDGANGRELWKTDGTTAGTVLVKDVNAGASGSAPGNAVIQNDVAYFRATDAQHGIELWRTDGTASGTWMVRDINPGPALGNATPLATLGDLLFFSASDGISGNELWSHYHSDTIAPTAGSMAFNVALGQVVTVQFSENVSASLAPTDLQVATYPSGTVFAPDAVNYNSLTNTATFVFLTPLPDGSYVATLPASAVQDSGGNNLTADAVYNFMWSGGTAGGDTFKVQLNGAGTSVELYVNSASPSFTATAATLGTIVLAGGAGADVLDADLINGDAIPTDRLRFDGGADSDALALLGIGGADSATSDPGEMLVSGAGSIVHLGVESTSFDGRGGLDTLTISTGAPPMLFPTSQQLQSLSLAAGASAALLAGGPRHLFIRTLSMAATATLDLNDNDIILDYTGASQLAAIQDLINSARNFGDWLGNGITSSSARTNPLQNTSLGAMEATDYDSVYGPGALFNGIDPDDSAVLIKYTYYGDTDFNGFVDGDDYARTDSGFNLGFSGWLNGDFDGNGFVDGDDYSLIDLAFNSQQLPL